MSDRPPPSLTARLTLATAVMESRRGPAPREAAARPWAVLALVLALLCLGAAAFHAAQAG